MEKIARRRINKMIDTPLSYKTAPCFTCRKETLQIVAGERLFCQECKCCFNHDTNLEEVKTK
jgi:hypothetical protein